MVREVRAHEPIEPAYRVMVPKGWIGWYGILCRERDEMLKHTRGRKEREKLRQAWEKDDVRLVLYPERLAPWMERVMRQEEVTYGTSSECDDCESPEPSGACAVSSDAGALGKGGSGQGEAGESIPAPISTGGEYE